MQTLRVGPGHSRERLDLFLVAYLKRVSRTTVQELIRAGSVTLNGTPARPASRVSTGDAITVGDYEEIPVRLGPEPVPFGVRYADDFVIVVDKPHGLVVHPAQKNPGATLVNGLLYRFGVLAGLPDAVRPGIVHRLDKDTSGVMVVARTDAAYQNLKDQFMARTITKRYNAIVHGVPRFQTDVIRTFLRPSAARYNRMEVAADGKESVTYYEIVHAYELFTLVEVFPKTGRMHQIRLHMRHIGHPVLCDPLYGRGERAITRGMIGGAVVEAHDRPVLARLALHARELEFDHPVTGARMHFESPLPEELVSFLNLLDDRFPSGTDRSGGNA
ncbi:MAG: RluA family pseudouridine synthase [Planctomycetota bacterium]